MGAAASSRGFTEAEAARVAIVAWLNTNEPTKSETLLDPSPVRAGNIPMDQLVAPVNPGPIIPPDERPPLTRPKAPIPATTRNADQVAEQLAERARKREAAHRCTPVKAGMPIPMCACGNARRQDGTWQRPIDADPPPPTDEDEW